MARRQTIKIYQEKLILLQFKRTYKIHTYTHSYLYRNILYTQEYTHTRKY